jgi:hypothetical protein
MEFIAACFFATWILLIVTFAVVRSFDEVEDRKVKKIYDSILDTEKFLREHIRAEVERADQKFKELDHSLNLKFEFLKKEIEETAKVVDEAKRMMTNTKIANNLVTRVRKDTHGA